MPTGRMLDLIHEMIAAKLGLHGLTVPFLIRRCTQGVALRLQAPGADNFDFSAESEDVIGRGATLDDAIEDSVQAYLLKKAKLGIELFTDPSETSERRTVH